MARRRFSREVESAISMASQRYGIDPNTMRGIARIESSGNPGLVNKYGYSGLYQLSRREFERAGGPRGSILDPTENAMAAARVFRGHQAEFEKKFNRAPSPAELYLVHNQGWGGYQAHMANPDRPAWENMASTREGRARAARDPDWPRRAVRDNTPRDARHFGQNITSRQLTDSWISRVGREGLDVGTTPPPLDDPEAMLASGNAGRFAEPRIQAPPSEDEALAFADRSGTTPTVDAVASATPNRIVRGVDDPMQSTVGDIFSGSGGKGGTGIFGGGPIFGDVPGAGKIGAGLAAAGKALSSARISVPQSPGPEAQMAELDRGAQQPVTIQPRKPRKPPGMGRGGAV